MEAEGIDVSKTASTIARLASMSSNEAISLSLANLAGKQG